MGDSYVRNMIGADRCYCLKMGWVIDMGNSCGWIKGEGEIVMVKIKFGWLGFDVYD